MKRISFFSIPARGHTNPMLPVAKELVKRGNEVRFYSFDQFEEEISSTGAKFISCDRFLPELNSRETKRMKNVSQTEMMLQDLRTTINMDLFLEEEFRENRPDIIFSDSVCFWGKLNAVKHHIPLVVSSSSFAFNRESSKYLRNSFKEKLDLILGLPRVSRELEKLKKFGYDVKDFLSLVESSDLTDTVVYTTKSFQPHGNSFSDHYFFAGPSVFTKELPKKHSDPLIYVSLGTVISDRKFLKSVIRALDGLDTRVVISAGTDINLNEFEDLIKNTKIEVYPFVNQMKILREADLFITHAGMNSVSESLYMGVPMLLFPQTAEERAVTRRVVEKGAGKRLEKASVKEIRENTEAVLDHSVYKKAATALMESYRDTPGAAGAADFIENTPH